MGIFVTQIIISTTPESDLSISNKVKFSCGLFVDHRRGKDHHIQKLDHNTSLLAFQYTKSVESSLIIDSFKIPNFKQLS